MSATPRRPRAARADAQPIGGGLSALASSAPTGEVRALHARVVSHTSGRLRVRVHAGNREPASMHAIGRRLEDALGPGRVELNKSSGSVLVHYDHHARSSADVLSLVRDVGIVLEDTARAVGLDVPGDALSTTGQSIVDALSDLNRQVFGLTGSKVDLKVLFPLTLGAVGLWRAARAGLGLDQVPAYVLLWYAFDSFWKFHAKPDGGSPPRDTDGAA